MGNATWIAVASAAVALTSLVFGLSVNHRQRRRLIAWSIQQDTPLVVPEGLDVEWRGRKLTDPRIVTVSFANVGNVAVSPTDLDRLPTARVVDAQLIQASAARLGRGAGRPLSGIGAEIRGDHVEVLPDAFPLEPGEAIRLEMLVDGPPGEVDASLAAAGFQFVSRHYAAENNDVRRRAVANVALLVLTLVAAISAALTLVAAG